MDEELRQAVEELKFAEMQFNNAAPEFTDIVIYQFNAAEAKRNLILKERRGIRC